MMLLKVRHFMHERRKLCSFVRLRKCDGFSAISSVTSLPSLLPKRPPAKLDDERVPAEYDTGRRR
jgi:hypothetical protein